MKERDISVDILKFIAALLITNSHMGLLYGKYSVLATGGSIGDVLFFFVSGFTLIKGKMGRFDNWYKRRINRIYPTVFAWAIISTFIFEYQNDMKYTILNGGGWFVSCIMIYYAILWFIRKMAENKLEWTFIVTSAVVLVSYFFFEQPQGWSMYGATYYKWIHYFLFMLLGAIIGKMSKQRFNFNFSHDLAKLTVCIVTFYVVFIVSLQIQYVAQWQILSLLPLLGTTYYLYKVCNSHLLKRCYDNRYVGWCVKFIGGLCLEIYMVQYTLFTDAMNCIFPLNILIMFLIIFAAAYLLRCVSRTFAQTFKEGEYDWREVFRTI